MTEAARARPGVAMVPSSPTSSFDGFIGTGQMSRNARVHPDVGPAGRSPGDRRRQVPDRRPADSCELVRERRLPQRVLVLRRARRDRRRAHPDVLGGPLRRRRPDFVLIMEDLAGSVQGDQFAGITVDEIALALEQAAGLHAPRWGDPTLADRAGPAAGRRRGAPSCSTATTAPVPRVHGPARPPPRRRCRRAHPGVRAPRPALERWHGHAAHRSSTATSDPTTSCSDDGRVRRRSPSSTGRSRHRRRPVGRSTTGRGRTGELVERARASARSASGRRTPWRPRWI